MPSAPSKSAHVRQLLATGMSPADIAKKVGCSTNLVYVVKSGAGAKKGGAGKGPRRGPGRPPKAATTGMQGLDGILAAVKNRERDRAAMRAALQRMRGIIDEALS